MPEPLGGFAYTWPFLAAFVLAYLLGSIPFGLVLTRLAGLGDVRRIGSGSTGATNVLRTGRRGLAALTLLLDSGKGAVAVLIANRFGPDMAVLAGAGAVLGHCFPLWIGFRGGKAVATALGVVLVLAPLVALLAFLVWLAVFLATRIVSVASLAGAAAAPPLAYLLADAQRAELCLFIAALIVLRHLANIRRLLRGEEPRTSLGSRGSAGR
jgi:acyl phosphate:glycerol-3-phosphate acyltransferase